MKNPFIVAALKALAIAAPIFLVALASGLPTEQGGVYAIVALLLRAAAELLPRKQA